MWLLFALLSAIFDSGKNVLAKKNTTHYNSVLISWTWVSISSLILVPLMFLAPLPHLTQQFWLAVISAGLLDVFSLVLYVEALRHSELSLSLPMLAFTPLFLIGSGYLINNELPNLIGFLGIFLVMCGVYFLNFKDAKHWLAPIAAIFKNRGAFLVFVVAIIWGVTGSIHKVGIVSSNALFYGGASSLFVLFFLTPLAFMKDRKQFISCLKPAHMVRLLPMGLLDGLSIFFQLLAQSLTLSVFAISLKRTSIIFSSLLAWYFFKEDIRHRILPILLMVGGIILITLA